MPPPSSSSSAWLPVLMRTAWRSRARGAAFRGSQASFAALSSKLASRTSCRGDRPHQWWPDGWPRPPWPSESRTLCKPCEPPLQAGQGGKGQREGVAATWVLHPCQAVSRSCWQQPRPAGCASPSNLSTLASDRPLISDRRCRKWRTGAREVSGQHPTEQGGVGAAPLATPQLGACPPSLCASADSHRCGILHANGRRHSRDSSTTRSSWGQQRRRRSGNAQLPQNPACILGLLQIQPIAAQRLQPLNGLSREQVAGRSDQALAGKALRGRCQGGARHPS